MCACSDPDVIRHAVNVVEIDGPAIAACGRAAAGKLHAGFGHRLIAPSVFLSYALPSVPSLLTMLGGRLGSGRSVFRRASG